MEMKFYTDGACSGNPGPGGAAVVSLIDGKKSTTTAGFRLTTNNRMEIRAVRCALYLAWSELGMSDGHDVTVTIYSDSQLVIGTMNSGWARKSNLDLWEQVDKYAGYLRDAGVELSFVKVKGHNGNPLNEEADRLAVAVSHNPEFVDSGYADGGQPALAGPPFNKKASAETPTITGVSLIGFADGQERKVKVELTNGTVVTIEGYMGGFSQYDCTQAESAVTVPVAERFKDWLNGGAL